MSQSVRFAGVSQSGERAETSSEGVSAKTSTENKCKECGGSLTKDERRGEVCCDDCGLVVDEDTIDHGPEWRSYGDEETDPRRTGPSRDETVHDRGLSTEIGWEGKDGYGNSISGRQRSRLRRLRKWNSRYQTDVEDQHLKHALGEIKRMGSALGHSKSVREEAAVTYRRAHQEDLLPGRSVEGVASGCLVIASRKDGVPTGFDDVANVSRVGKSEIVSAYKYVMRELGLEVPPPNSKDYIPRFASEFDVSDAVERRAVEIISKAIGDTYHSGKDPRALAATAIYLADQLGHGRLVQCEVAEAVNVSEVTIRNRRDDLLELALIPENSVLPLEFWTSI